MALLPDCVENNIETKKLKKIAVLFKNSRLTSVKGQTWNEKISDSPWKLSVEDSNVDDGLKMSITCTGSKNDNWKLMASRLSVQFEHGDELNTKSIEEREFNASDNTVEVFLTRQELSRLVGDVEGGGFKYLMVSMTLEWTEKVGMSHLRSIRYDFRRQTENSSMVIAIGNERFYVNLGYLAQVSHFFSDIRRDTASLEKHDSTGLWLLKLDDVEASEFEELLKLLYPTDCDTSLTAENVEIVAKLSNRFKCPLVQVFCAGELSEIEDISPAKMLAICEKFNLEWNIENLINHMRTKDIHGMVTSPEFHTLSQNTMKLLVIRMTKGDSNDRKKNNDNDDLITAMSPSVISVTLSSASGSDSDE